MSDKSYGKIKFFNETKGYGFIIPDDTKSTDVFFHIKNVAGGKVNPPQKDDHVSYVLVDGKQGKEAGDVIVVG